MRKCELLIFLCLNAKITEQRIKILGGPKRFGRVYFIYTFLGDSQNYQPQGDADHLMNNRPRAIIHQVVHSTEELTVLTVAQKGMI